jgi:nitroimidazol reductase NimA-like FMN-containing flavoprotein (pyridoxamine 5'-phosphate oxidase superfamily)
VTARPRSVRLDAGEAWDRIRDAHTAIFVSLRRDGVPIALPVWHVVFDRNIYIGTRGKKVVRVRHDSRASVLVEGGERWRDLWGVHVTGRAEVLDPDPELEARVAAEEERKYASYRTPREQMPDATRARYESLGTALIRLVPDDRILSWDNTRLGLG